MASSKTSGEGTLKGCLRAARNAISAGDYREALRHCKAALRHDKRSFDASLFAGKAAYCLHEYDHSEAAYRKALDVNPKGLPAWQGLAELHTATGDKAKVIDAWEHIRQLSSEAGDTDRVYDYTRRLALAYGTEGRREDELKTWRSLANSNEGAVSSAVRIEALCRIADAEMETMTQDIDAAAKRGIAKWKKANQQLASAELGGPVTDSQDSWNEDKVRRLVADEWRDAHAGVVESTLLDVVEAAPAFGEQLQYHEKLLQLRLACLRHRRRTGVAWDQVRTAASLVLEQCVRMIKKQSAISTPWEVAMSFCEDDHANEICEPLRPIFDSTGMNLEQEWSQMRRNVWKGLLGRKLLHAFPLHYDGLVGLVCALRTEISRSIRQGAGVFEEALIQYQENCSSVSGWLMLTELKLLHQDFEGTLECADKGRQCVIQAQDELGLGLSRAEMELIVLQAKALAELGDLDRAESLLHHVLQRAEAASLDDKLHIGMAAKKGLAGVCLRSGKDAEGRQLLEEIVEWDDRNDWAVGELGWLAFTNGDNQAAIDLLSSAISIQPKSYLHHLRLGKVYWNSREELTDGSSKSHARLLEAAKINPRCAEAFRYLGLVYRTALGDLQRASRCFQKAISLDAQDRVSGEAVCDILEETGQKALHMSICREACEQSPKATWAWLRLGMLQVEREEWEEGVMRLQQALRGDPRNVLAWEALAYAYQQLGRFTAALKSYGRVLQLDSDRVFSLIQASIINHQMGLHSKAVEGFQRALCRSPKHVAALCGLVSALKGQAEVSVFSGAYGAAASFLKEAESHIVLCRELHPTLQLARKLHGDIMILYARVVPYEDDTKDEKGAEDDKAVEESKGAVGILKKMEEEKKEAGLRAIRSYSHALHKHPSNEGAWADLAFAYYQHAHLLSLQLVPKAPKEEIERLSSFAERLALGALRLNGGNAMLWNLLGVVARRKFLRQHAFIRALQIDSKLPIVWANLGQLYLLEGEAEMANRAFNEARILDSRIASPWVGMAYVLSKSDSAEKLDEAFSTCQHCLPFATMPEARWGFGLVASRAGLLHKAEVYAALQQCITQTPQEVSVFNVAALSAEARGLIQEAIALLKAAEEIACLEVGSPMASEELRKDQVSSLQKKIMISLNLARVLMKAGRAAEALAIYQHVLHDEVASAASASLLRGQNELSIIRGYAIALWSSGHDSSVATSTGIQSLTTALQKASSSPPSPQYLATLRVLCQLYYHHLGPSGTAAILDCLTAVPAVCLEDTQLQSAGLASVVASRRFIDMSHMLSLCRTLFDHSSAHVGQMIITDAYCIQGDYAQAVRHLKRALHRYPHLVSLRGALGRALLNLSIENVPKALHICLLSDEGFSDAENREGKALCDAVCAWCAFACYACGMARGCHSTPFDHHTQAEQLQTLCRKLQRLVHMNPSNGSARLLMIATGLQRARSLHYPSGLCTGLLRASMQSLSLSVKEGLSPLERALLAICASELALHVRKDGAISLGLRLAKKAVQVANVPDSKPESPLHAVSPLVRRQIGRCHAAAGEWHQAFLAHQEAMSDALERFDFPAALEVLEAMYLVGKKSEAEVELRRFEQAVQQMGTVGEKNVWLGALRALQGQTKGDEGDGPAAVRFTSEAVTWTDEDNAVLHYLDGALRLESAEAEKDIEGVVLAKRSLGRALIMTQSELGKPKVSPLSHAGVGAGIGGIYLLLARAEMLSNRGAPPSASRLAKWTDLIKHEWSLWPRGTQPAELCFQMGVISGMSSSSKGGDSWEEEGSNRNKTPSLGTQGWFQRAVHLDPTCHRFWRRMILA